MREYQFSTKDFELLKKLLKVTKNIKLVYNDLYNLEVNNKKNSDEYRELVKTLKYHIKKEEEYYSLISDKIESMYSYMDCLFPNGCNEFEEEIEFLKYDKESDILRMRLSNKINELINNYSFEDDFYDSEEEVYENEEELIDYEKEYQKGVLIENTIKDDIYSSILVILNKYINNDKYSFVVNKLIEFKYNYSYMHKNAEKSMLDNNFEINNDLYIKSILITEMQGKNINDTYDVLTDYIKDIYEMQLRDLVYLIKDENNIDIKNEQVVLTTMLLRSLCLFMTKREVNNFKSTINLELLLSMLDNTKVIDIIEEMISERDKDMEIPKVLSLRPLK